MISSKAAVLVHPHGCSFRSIPPYQHRCIYLLDANSLLINSVEQIPNYQTSPEAAADHVDRFIDPKQFHNIHLLHDFTDVPAIKTAADLDMTASFVFVGSIPEIYRPILSGRTVRVATRFEDLGNIFDGLFESLIVSFVSYLQKEYTSSQAQSHSAEDVADSQSLNKYAERLFQSSKDIFKVIQTATGPLQMPAMPSFSRKTGHSSSRDEEVKKLVNDGIFALIFDVNVLESIWGRIQKLKGGLEWTGELALLSDNGGKTAHLSNNLFKNIRIIMIAVRLGHQRTIDWSPLVKYYYSQQYACRLAAFLVPENSIRSRHFTAMKGMVTERGTIGWTATIVGPSALQSQVTVLPHEYIHLQSELSDKISSIKSKDSTVIIHRFEQIGTNVFVEVETHLRTSQSINLAVDTDFETLTWNVDFEVDEDYCAFLRLYQTGKRRLLHIKADHLKVIEYACDNKNTIVGTSASESEWLIHTPKSEHLTSITLQTSNHRTLKWSGEYLRRVCT